MRFLLRVDSHARNHSAHPQAQSRVAALRAYPCSDALRACSAAPTARSARVSGRYIPILRSSKRSSAVTQPPGSCAVSARTSLSCLIVRLCSCIRSSCSAVGRSGLRHLLPVHTVTTVFSSSGRTHVALAASSFCCLAPSARRAEIFVEAGDVYVRILHNLDGPAGGGPRRRGMQRRPVCPGTGAA